MTTSASTPASASSSSSSSPTGSSSSTSSSTSSSSPASAAAAALASLSALAFARASLACLRSSTAAAFSAFTSAMCFSLSSSNLLNFLRAMRNFRFRSAVRGVSTSSASSGSGGSGGGFFRSKRTARQSVSPSRCLAHFTLSLYPKDDRLAFPSRNSLRALSYRTTYGVSRSDWRWCSVGATSSSILAMTVRLLLSPGIDMTSRDCSSRAATTASSTPFSVSNCPSRSEMTSAF
mmetsp:Transcript_54118/g.90159  ORF Transcript_54118/g.90159 Transcript_54118/m.90159 type:complete len:234 (-) Transcript_54118:2690-3391(-)